MTYVLLEVGCLECKEPTTVLGTFDDVDAADAAFEAELRDYDPVSKPEPEFFNGTALRASSFGRLQLHKTTEEAT